MTKYTKLFSVESMVTQWYGMTDYAVKAHAKGWYSKPNHLGLDLVPKDRKSWELYLPFAAGMITELEDDGDKGYGLHIRIRDRETGYIWLFAHLDKVANVLWTKEYGGIGFTYGDKFAVAGNSGNSTARHLHLGIQIPGYNTHTHNYTDPLPILQMMGVHV